MKSYLVILLALALTPKAIASTPRVLDGAQITNGAATLTLPTTTDTIIGRATTDTLTNKTLTAPSITSPTGITKSDVGLANVDNTSDATKNAATATLTNKTIDYNSNTITNLPVTAPSLNGGSGSAQSVTAAGGITLTGLTFSNNAWIAGSAGAVTVTKTPSITACTADGQKLQVIGTSNTNTVTLQDVTALASSGLSLNGNFKASKDSVLNLHCDITQSLWVEDSRR